MDVRKLLVVLLVGLGLLTPSICAATQSITLPLRTATIAVAGNDWPYDGHPDTHYQLWIDPVTLRVGYDQESGLVYESFLVADMGDLTNTGNGATLHLSTVTATPGAIFAVTPLSLEHSVPEPMDFAWLSRLLALGDVMVIQDPYPFGLNTYEVWDGGGRYHAWYLGMNTGYGEFAGVGDPLHAPYTVITTVPEPSTLACLLISLAALSFFVLVRRKESRSIAVCSALVCILVCGPSLADK